MVNMVIIVHDHDWGVFLAMNNMLVNQQTIPSIMYWLFFYRFKDAN